MGVRLVLTPARVCDSYVPRVHSDRESRVPRNCVESAKRFKPPRIKFDPTPEASIVASAIRREPFRAQASRREGTAVSARSGGWRQPRCLCLTRALPVRPVARPPRTNVGSPLETALTIPAREVRGGGLSLAGQPSRPPRVLLFCSARFSIPRLLARGHVRPEAQTGVAARPGGNPARVPIASSGRELVPRLPGLGGRVAHRLEFPVERFQETH